MWKERKEASAATSKHIPLRATAALDGPDSILSPVEVPADHLDQALQPPEQLGCCWGLCQRWKDLPYAVSAATQLSLGIRNSCSLHEATDATPA